MLTIVVSHQVAAECPCQGYGVTAAAFGLFVIAYFCIASAKYAIADQPNAATWAASVTVAPSVDNMGEERRSASHRPTRVSVCELRVRHQPLRSSSLHFIHCGLSEHFESPALHGAVDGDKLSIGIKGYLDRAM